jgi:molecular chaperone GrpE (heat shock protein)
VQGGKDEPGTVVDQLQRGYRWGNELLRPARVRVAI